MYTVLPESEGNVVGFKVVGDLDSKDYGQMFDMVDELIKKHGKIRILADLREYKAQYYLDAIMAFPKRLKYLNTVEKKAVVTDEHWIYTIASFTTPFFRPQVKLFHSNEIDTAWEWVRS